MALDPVLALDPGHGPRGVLRGQQCTVAVLVEGSTSAVATLGRKMVQEEVRVGE